MHEFSLEASLSQTRESSSEEVREETLLTVSRHPLERFSSNDDVGMFRSRNIADTRIRS